MFDRLTLHALAALALALPSLAQAPGWSPLRNFAPHSEPTSVACGRAFATDFARGTIVSFGCYAASSVIADTWEWGGTQWTPRDPARTPPARSEGVLVYDSIRQRTVLFGGVSSALLNDTWEWDGERWTQRQPVNFPPPSVSHAAAFDSARGKLVMFGSGVLSAFTFEYDGTTWFMHSPAHSPPARARHGMAFDEIRRRTVLFGGDAVSGATETWEWDGVDWTLAATLGPAARRSPLLLFDRARGLTVLCGGGNPSFGQPDRADTWEWDGVAWQQRTSTLPFAGTFGLAGAVEPSTGSALVFASGRVWRWNGAAWARVEIAARGPEGAYGVVACTDTARNRIVSLGCRDSSNPLPDTWEWDGDRWHFAEVPGPPPLTGTAIAFDPVRARSVLFGGTLARTMNVTDATWEWDGVAWVSRTLATRPLARSGHAMAYDQARGQIVMFGGYVLDPFGYPIFFGDTWVYDGTTWSSRPGGPSGRNGHAMAYDPIRQRVVMHGWGADGDLRTWEWDGATWTGITTTNPPQVGGGCGMAFDPTRGKVVLVGLLGSPSPSGRIGTWEWTGTAWTPVATSSDPLARSNLAVAFDPVRQQILLHGGRHCRIPQSCIGRSDTWALGTPLTPQLGDFGAGCSAGTPPVLGSPTPYLGHRDFVLELRAVAPHAVCAVGIAASPQSLALGPCTIYLANVIDVRAATANAYGVAKASLPLPVTPSLRGVALVTQGVVLASPGAVAGLDFSAARVLVLGD